MPDIKVIVHDGQTRTIAATTGRLLMATLRDGVDEILAICGGCCVTIAPRADRAAARDGT